VIRAIISSACLALCVANGLARAETDGPPAWARWEQRVHRLDLQPAQREKVQKILAASHTERQAIQGRVRQAAQELDQLLQQPDTKEQAILRQADKLGELTTERQKAMLRALLQVRAVLTPEQRQQLLAKPPAGTKTPQRPSSPAADETPAATPPAP
jgi:Spy/CpxP family protein refolding chaperone